MIFSAIISTLSIEALPHVIGFSTSSEVWLTLETLFSARSQSRIMQLGAFFFFSFHMLYLWTEAFLSPVSISYFDFIVRFSMPS